MQFSSHTLRRTFRRFNKALKTRELSLSLSTAQNVWAQIVLGKDFSAAIAQANREYKVQAVPITAETICARLRERSRNIDINLAYEIFADAIGDDMPELSFCMAELLRIIALLDRSCLVSVLSDPSGLGIMDETKAGYIPVSQMYFMEGREAEIEWLRSSSELIARVVNHLNGINGECSFKIFAANHRIGEEKQNEVFANYVGKRVTQISKTIATGILDEFTMAEMKDKNAIDFDAVRWTVFSILYEDLRKSKENWLSAECQLGEALIDHLAARIREQLPLLSEWENNEEIGSYSDAIAHTAQLSIGRILGMQNAAPKEKQSA